MTTLKEFEDALREQGMHMALAILEKLRERDRGKRSAAPARRIAGRKMTPELARRILELHATTEMTQQEIAFELGVNQGRVNEVIKRGKWLEDDPTSPEAVARDKAKARMKDEGGRNRLSRSAASEKRPKRKPVPQAQLNLGDL
ncbi:sigma factor-like helix-turn-helix DNA-binding protein [Microvirga sp. TS319]|uniref:sigma factor-like helix-turn-helix DNA-binding protein n=1 Tax=Microvirga sp. TS319 TaxID=3241165 RepID=UPI00351A2326